MNTVPARGKAATSLAIALAFLCFCPRLQSAEAGTDWRVTVREFAAQHFRNPAWGYSHCIRDYDLARELAAEDHVALDDDVLYAAAYLHDIAAFPPWEKERVDHADEGARIVDTVLKGTGFPMSKIEAVRAAIRTHMFDRKPVGPESSYLHDADALDWLGAIGVARVIALADPNGGEPTVPVVVKMLEKNLADVPGGVVSPAAKARAPQLTRELATFLSDLRRESSDFRSL